MKGIGLKEEELKKKLKKIKEMNYKIRETLKLNQDELLKMSDSDLIKNYETFINEKILRNIIKLNNIYFIF